MKPFLPKPCEKCGHSDAIFLFERYQTYWVENGNQVRYIPPYHSYHSSSFYLSRNSDPEPHLYEYAGEKEVFHCQCNKCKFTWDQDEKQVGDLNPFAPIKAAFDVKVAAWKEREKIREKEEMVKSQPEPEKVKKIGFWWFD